MSFLPGLPSLASYAAFSTVVQLIGDLIGAPSNQQWGIYRNGVPVVIADNVVSVDFKQEFSISKYPIERGAFSSYNKVQSPIETKLRFSTGGSEEDRIDFLNSIQAIIGDTNLYDVVTPEAVYPNLNLIHQDYRRTATGGAGLITVDVWCEEVRPASSFSSNTATGSTGNASGTNQTTTTIPAGDNGSFTPQQRINSGFAAVNTPQDPQATPQVNSGNLAPQTPTTSETADFSAALKTQPFNF